MILRDPVHGLITFGDEIETIVVRLMDSAEVQRLRRIRALGPAAMAFPGAEHSRFSHAVGSAHVMNRYLARVRELSGDLPTHDRIGPDQVRVALAAALLHDVGHGPYSHTFEAAVPGSVPHETWTSRIVMDPTTEVHQVLRDIDPALPQSVERLIHGVHPIHHLARAVSGTFDVDRCDYLMRDSHMTGVRYGLLDLDWLLQSLRLHPLDGSQAASLAVDGEKGLTAVEGFFLSRLYMYQQVYLHKAVRAAETVLKALMQRLYEVGPQPGTPAAMQAMLRGESVDTRAFLSLDDHALHAALASYAEGGEPVLAQLARRVRERRLFKTMALRPDVAAETSEARLEEILDRTQTFPRYLARIDRVELAPYPEDTGLVVLQRGKVHALRDVSAVLRGLSREAFVLHRVIFPPELREAIEHGLADLA